MNLDEMLAASGITGSAAADGKNVKSGFVTLIGRPNVGKVNTYESYDRSENCHYV